MALKLDPISGQMIDDGLPEVDGAAPPLVDPDALDVAPGVGPENLQNQSGGVGQPAAAPATTTAPTGPATGGIQAATVFPAKPEHESKVEHSQKQGGLVESAATKAADAELQAARDKAQAALDADTAIKVRDAEAKAEDAKLARLTAEKKAAADAYWTDQKNRKLEEIKAADDAAIEASKKDETLKNNAGIVTGAAKTWATLLTAVGAIGQGLAAAGSRGAQAWQDGNPIAKLYEEDRQKAQKLALDEFQKSERYRALKKAGRDAELKVIEDRLTIGVNNEFKRDTDLREAILAERIAKQGPQAQRVMGELAKTGKAEVYATINRENAGKYDQHLEQGRSDEVIKRSPTGTGQAAVNKTLVLDKDGQPVGNAPNEQQADKLAEQRRAIAKAGVLRERLAELAPKLNAVDRITNAVLKDKLQQEFDSTLYDLGSQVSVANGQASMTGAERKDFLAQNGRGWLEEGTEFAALQKAKQAQAWDQYDKQANASVIGGAAPTKDGAPALAAKPGPKTELGKQAASRMAPAAWKGVRKVISSGTYERTGPGPNDWKKVK
jgi:hypothetical protein